MQRYLLAALLLLIPARAIPARTDYASLIPVLQAHEARLLTIGWRLARGNAGFCRSRAPAIGAMLTAAEDFNRPAEARAAMRIKGNLAVAAVASGSPAEASGLRAGEELLTVEGAPVAAKARAYERIEAALASRGAVTLTLASPGAVARQVTIRGEPACAGRFELLPGSKIARADGVSVLVGVDLLAEHRRDDVAATMIAHEMAHNILVHLDRLDAGTRNYVTIRRTEREADGLAPWLMANAGYDPGAAPRFMAAWGPRHSGGAARRPNHDSWQDRAALMQAEVAKIAASRAANPQGPLDWRTAFPGQDGRAAR